MRVLTLAPHVQCPCGSSGSFDRCCGPYLRGAKAPPTAEALMRSRYTAYTQGDIDYIGKTVAPEAVPAFDAQVARQWAEQSRWLGLQIVGTKQGLADDDLGTVEFVATYKQDGRTFDHHEISRFRKSESGAWLYLHGDMPPPDKRQQTVARDAPKVGRNDPCPCGSGKKFKKCCGANG